jgi:hypothetical protein
VLSEREIRMKRPVSVFAAVSLLVASSVFAAATIDEKTQVHFGGFIGGIANVFGGKATREGVDSTVVLKGDRRLRMTGGSGELVDLQQEKVYHIDFDRKTYRVVTFDELRKQLEESKERAGKQQQTKPEKNAKEYDVDVKETGAKETIAGYPAREVITTVTVHEKGMKLEQSGGAVLTADMWMAPKIAAVRDVEEFERRFVQKVYGQTMGSEDVQKMALLVATTPTFAKAMKKFYEHRSAFEGTAVRTALKFETVADPRAQSEAGKDEGASPSRMIGGLLAKARRKDAEEKGAENRQTLFDSKTEVLKAASVADDARLAVPAGFTQR